MIVSFWLMIFFENIDDRYSKLYHWYDDDGRHDIPLTDCVISIIDIFCVTIWCGEVTQYGSLIQACSMVVMTDDSDWWPVLMSMMMRASGWYSQAVVIPMMNWHYYSYSQWWYDSVVSQWCDLESDDD